MKINLRHRHYGVHELVKSTIIPGIFTEYFDETSDYVNEELLLRNIPKDFLPVKPKKCLLTVEDIDSEGEVFGGHAPDHITEFRIWGKYFDSYSLELCREKTVMGMTEKEIGLIADQLIEESKKHDVID